jgi:uncharacterized protein YkwD
MKLLPLVLLLMFCTVTMAEETEEEKLPDYKVAALKSMNERRTRIGRKPVTYSKELNECADKHAEWMAKYGMSHTGVNGSRPYHRVQWAKYPGRFTGEIICVSDRQSRAVAMWTNSGPHYSIMVNSGATEVGLSCGESTNGTRYWVAVFGRR